VTVWAQEWRPFLARNFSTVTSYSWIVISSLPGIRFCCFRLMPQRIRLDVDGGATGIFHEPFTSGDCTRHKIHILCSIFGGLKYGRVLVHAQAQDLAPHFNTTQQDVQERGRARMGLEMLNRASRLPGFHTIDNMVNARNSLCLLNRTAAPRPQPHAQTGRSLRAAV
jgi:hypothetical protein